MATRPGLDSSIINRLGADHQELFYAVKAEFDSGDVNLWTGLNDLVIGSDTYTGAGDLLGISNIEDSLELASTHITLTVSGIDSSILSLALTESYQNRPITIYLGYLMGSTNEVAGTLTLFKGRMVSMTTTDTPQGINISLDCENRLLDLTRPSNYRYTKEDLMIVYYTFSI